MGTEMVRYRTLPSLIFLTLGLFGPLFLGLLIQLMLPSFLQTHDILLGVCISIPALFIILGFYSLLTIRVVELRDESIAFPYLFLPFRKEYPLDELVSSTKDVRKMVDNYGSKVYTYRSAVFSFSNGQKVIIGGVGAKDFKQLVKAISLSRWKYGQVPVKRLSLKQYLFDNIGGLFWTIFFLIMTTGLAIGIFGR